MTSLNVLNNYKTPSVQLEYSGPLWNSINWTWTSPIWRAKFAELENVTEEIEGKFQKCLQLKQMLKLKVK
jgi:Golgi nucleoside diphosphatase